MGIFSRKPRDGLAPAATGPKHHHDKGTPYYSMNTRPSFGQWLKHTWLDIVTMVIMGVIGLGVSHKSLCGLQMLTIPSGPEPTTDAQH